MVFTSELSKHEKNENQFISWHF